MILFCISNYIVYISYFKKSFQYPFMISNGVRLVHTIIPGIYRVKALGDIDIGVTSMEYTHITKG